jgi:hypothetical protein
MTFAVEEMSLEQGFWLISFRFPLRINIPPLFHTHLTSSPEVYHIPDQAAHYHFHGLQVGDLICDPGRDWSRSDAVSIT